MAKIKPYTIITSNSTNLEGLQWDTQVKSPNNNGFIFRATRNKFAIGGETNACNRSYVSIQGGLEFWCVQLPYVETAVLGDG